jgi:hypothetical protein
MRESTPGLSSARVGVELHPCTSVTTTIAEASQRNAGSGRLSLTKAAAGDISASAIVSQPFSSTKVSASASATSVPVADSVQAMFVAAPAVRLCDANFWNALAM